MLNLAIQTWWLWFLFVGVVMFAIGFPLTVRLLFAGKWANWLFIFTLALAGLGLLTLASGALYIYIQPAEALLVPVSEPPPPPSGQFQTLHLETVLAEIVNVWVRLFFKSALGGYLAFLGAALLGLFALRVLANEVITLVKKRT